MSWLPAILVAIATIVCIGAGMFVAVVYYDAPTTDDPPNGSGRF